MTQPRRVDVAEAIVIINGAMSPVEAETIALRDALGRVLSEDVVAPWALPPWTNASMDGYAVHAPDIHGATPASPRTLRVVGESRPGGAHPPSPAAGEAVRIYTGALVPSLADSVVRQEDTTRDGDVLSVSSDQDAERNVRMAGSDLTAGTLALTGGQRLGPEQMALLAALGVAQPQVRRLPRIGILVSGDELVHYDDITALRRGDRLADSNALMLAALVSQAGAIPIQLGLAPDNPEEIKARILAAPPLDLLVTAGGVSVGDHDHLPGVMASLNAELRFRRVRLRPGGPTCFATRADGPPWLGLPGNPGAAFVTFHLFVRPAIDTLLGRDRKSRELVVSLTQQIPRHQVLDLYHRITLGATDSNGVPTAHLTGAQGSGLLTSLAAAEAILFLPAGERPAGIGEHCLALPC